MYTQIPLTDRNKYAREETIMRRPTSSDTYAYMSRLIHIHTEMEQVVQLNNFFFSENKGDDLFFFVAKITFFLSIPGYV